MKNLLDNYASSIYDFLLKNKTLIIISLFIAVLSYGYELFNFTFSIDEEFDSFTGAVELKRRILTGRWGAYYLNRLFVPYSVLPYFPTLITIVCIAFSSVLFIGNVKGSFWAKAVFCVLFISFPLHAYYLTFNILNFSIGIGFILSVSSFLLIKNTLKHEHLKYLPILAAIPLLTFSMGVYRIHPTNPSCQYFHETIALLKKEYARRNQNSGYVRPC